MKQHYLTRWGLLFLAFLILLFPIVSFAQNTLSGRVTDNDGQPVVGATVAVTGTTNGTSTAAGGLYQLTLPANASQITVSAIGYLAQNVQISGRPTINISLRVNISSLNEVVVTGYTSQRRKDITGSVAIVDVASLKTVPAGNTATLLQGQASGVTVTNSGQPGAATSINVRGVGSIFSTAPLVIIDGTPGSLNDINVTDIESIQVLKDAGSAAIYGVRGSNGVVIVTTKKGRPGRSQITYDGLYGTTQPLKRGFRLGDTKTYMEAEYESYKNDGTLGANKQFDPKNTGTWSIPDFISPAGAHTGDPGTTLKDYTLNPLTGNGNQITLANKQGTDWFHTIFRPAPLQSHTITASGGNEKSTYLMSANYFNQQGTLLSTYEKRYSLRANTEFNINNHIRVGENAYMFYRNNPQIGNQSEGNLISYTYREPPIIPEYDIAGNYAGSRSPGLSNSQNGFANAMRNVVTNKLRGNNSDWQMTGNAFAEVDFLKHFIIRTQFGGTFDNFYNRYFGFTAYENAEGNTNQNSYTELSGYNSSYTWTNTLKYSEQFGKHNLKLLLGTESINNYGRQVLGSNGNYVVSVDPNYVDLDTGSPSGYFTNNNYGGVYSNTLQSYFARLDYSFADKYLLSATVRRDGSSFFAPGRQYGTFPTATLGWRVSQEGFLKEVTWLNDLKLRGGYGSLGSLSGVSTQPYNASNLYASNGGNSFYDINGTGNSSQLGTYASQLGNKRTTWETDKELNVGLDASLFNHVDFSIEYYKKTTTGLLFRPQLLPTQTFASAPYVNAGNIQNTGIDFNGNYHASINDFRFNIGINLTHYKNIVKSLDASIPYLDVNSGNGGNGSTRLANFVRLQPGQPLGEMFGYQVLGLYKDAAEVANNPAYPGAKPGLFKLKDVNGDGKIDANDRTFIGNPNPKLTGGLNLSASYKGFDLNAFFYGVYGNKVANYVKYWTDFPQVFDGNVSADILTNSWHQDADNSHAKIPILSRQASLGNTGAFNSFYLEDGSFLKLKSLQIGYSIPATVLKNYGISRFRIYVLANNLFTITKYTGLDPELPPSTLNNGAQGDNTSFGIDFGNYPANEKRYSIGVQVTF